MSSRALATTFGDLTRALSAPGSIFPHVPYPMRVITSRYRDGKATLHIVSMGDGVRFYLADDYDIRSLRNGSTPDELELSPCGDSFEEDE